MILLKISYINSKTQTLHESCNFLRLSCKYALQQRQILYELRTKGQITNVSTKDSIHQENNEHLYTMDNLGDA